MIAEEFKDERGYTQSVVRGIAVWLMGGIIFWMTEIAMVMLKIPGSWDYRLPMLDALALAVRPGGAALAALLYMAAATAGGFLASSVAHALFGGGKRTSADLFTATAFLVFNLLCFGGLWLNIKYQPPLFTFRSLAVSSVFILACLVFGRLSFLWLARRGEASFIPLYAALCFSINFLMFAELIIVNRFPGGLRNPKGMGAAAGVLVAFPALLYMLSKSRLLGSRDTVTPKPGVPERVIFPAALALAVLSAAVTAASGGGAGRTPGDHGLTAGEKPNVVFIVMDTARDDRLSCYGHTRDTTPNIDSIAREGVIYRNAYAPSSWTYPSHASMFTGMFAAEHKDGNDAIYLPDGVTTIAEILRESGYRTFAYSNNPWVSIYTGLHQGFDNFEEGWRESKPEKYFYAQVWMELKKHARRNILARRVPDHGAAMTNSYVFEWTEKNRRDPFFIFINYMEPHLPYALPADYKSKYLPQEAAEADIGKYRPGNLNIGEFVLRKERSLFELSVLNALYDAEMNYLDMRIGELYSYLDRQGVIENTLLIITSDHGENLGDHGLLGHAYGLWDTLLRVPLIIRYPGGFGPGLVIENGVQLTDLFYTILEAAGVEPSSSAAVPGMSLMERHSRNVYQEVMFAEQKRPKHALSAAIRSGIDVEQVDKDRWCVISDGYKYVRTSRDDEELYDLNADPGELSNVLSEKPGAGARMREKLASLREKLKPSETEGRGRRMDGETRERLKSLGYIN